MQTAKFNRSIINAPFGKLEIVFDDKDIVYILGFDTKSGAQINKILSKSFPNSQITINDAALSEFLQTAFDNYFAGKNGAFDNIQTRQIGTDFQMAAWRALQTIPYGQTISYGEQAKRLNNPKAVRAVGGANNKNNIAIIIPCHRVIGANGKMVGFGGGIGVKEWLLAHESPPL